MHLSYSRRTILKTLVLLANLTIFHHASPSLAALEHTECVEEARPLLHQPGRDPGPPGKSSKIPSENYKLLSQTGPYVPDDPQVDHDSIAAATARLRPEKQVDVELLRRRYMMIDSSHHQSEKDKQILEKTWATMKQRASQHTGSMDELKEVLDDIVSEATIEKVRASRERGLFRRLWDDYILRAFKKMQTFFRKSTATKLQQIRREYSEKFTAEQNLAILKLSALEESGIPLSRDQLQLIDDMGRSPLRLTKKGNDWLALAYTESSTQLKLKRVQEIQTMLESHVRREASLIMGEKELKNTFKSLKETINRERPLSEGQTYFLSKAEEIGNDWKKPVIDLLKDNKINFEHLSQGM